MTRGGAWADSANSSRPIRKGDFMSCASTTGWNTESSSRSRRVSTAGFDRSGERPGTSFSEARSEDRLQEGLQAVLLEVDLGAGLGRVAGALDPLGQGADLQA